MSDLSFQSPWLLLLLPLAAVPALLAYIWTQWMGQATMRYTDIGLVVSNRRSLRLRLTPSVPALRLLALGLVIVAAAGPRLADAREVIRGEGVDIAIALDVSGSMAETDFEPHRLAAAKAIITDFIEERRYDRIGLVVFAREAFIQSPPTLDHGALVRLLKDVDLASEMRIDDGTAIGSGMATAANMLKDSSAESKLVTLITDGVNTGGELDPITVATAAEAVGIKLYTIGVGRSDGGDNSQFASSGSEDAIRENPLDEENTQADSGYHERKVLPSNRYGRASRHLRRDQRLGEVGRRNTELRPLSRDFGLVLGSGSVADTGGAHPFKYNIQEASLTSL